MKVHEYQAKTFFAGYGVPVDKHVLCRTADEAVAAYRELGTEKAVVKAQVHTGGRGKAGGVKLGSGEAEIRQHAEAILGDRKSTRLNSSHANISYAVFCLKKKSMKDR